MASTPAPKSATDDTPVTAEVVADTNVVKPDPDAFSTTVDDLQARAADFFATQGYTSVDVAGAYAGVDGSKSVTLTDAKARIKSWLKADVQTDQN